MFSVVEDGQIFVIVRNAFANDLIGGTPISRQAAAEVFRGAARDGRRSWDFRPDVCHLGSAAAPTQGLMCQVVEIGQ